MAQEYFSIALKSDISLAVPLANIGKIIQPETRNICLVPGVSSFWYGVINFKGSLLWILDSDRYFDLAHTSQNVPFKKLLSIVIKQYREDEVKQVAIVTPKLEGIVVIEPSQLEPITNGSLSNLANCCSHIVIDRNKKTYILNPAVLLEQLHKQSSMLSV